MAGTEILRFTVFVPDVQRVITQYLRQLNPGDSSRWLTDGYTLIDETTGDLPGMIHSLGIWFSLIELDDYSEIMVDDFAYYAMSYVYDDALVITAVALTECQTEEVAEMCLITRLADGRYCHAMWTKHGK